MHTQHVSVTETHVRPDERDADTHMGQAGLFYFTDGVDTFWSARYRYENEDAVGPEFDFDAHIIAGALHTRLPAGGPENRLEISLEYEARNYDAVTPSINEIRDDDRFTAQVSWEVPLDEMFFVLAEYRFRDFSSNLPSADYTENVATIQLGARF